MDNAMHYQPTNILTTVNYEKEGKQTGYLRLPHSVHRSAYGWLPVPVACIKRGTGPTVLLISGTHGDENEGFQDEGDFGPREFFSSPPGWQAAVIAISKIPDRERPGKVVGDYPGGEVSHDNLLRVLSRAINSNQAISREFKSEEDIIQDLRYHGVLQG